MRQALIWSAYLVLALDASESAFSVNDDVFAYPQYDISFASTHILEHEASAKIDAFYTQRDSTLQTAEHDVAGYERMTLGGIPYLCAIPAVYPPQNNTEEKPSEEDHEKELVRAADRGWQLLSDLEGKQCLYYSTGWWSYSFCYNSHVKQFHAISTGGRVWPPQEDPTTPSYFLGKHDPQAKAEDKSLAEVQTKAETSYLVQRLQGGTPCDLTGENRKVDIQFHCHPQSADRIGWIKETATCAYLMVIYTPRLCNDVAFQPAKATQAHTISCSQVLTPDQAASIQQQQDSPAAEPEHRTMVGNIEIGGMKIIGRDAEKIERGRIVMTPEEKAEIVIMQKDGLIQGLSKTDLRKLNLNPDDVEAFRKALQKKAGTNDWKVERLGRLDGKIELRGTVFGDEENTEYTADDGEGTEEEYKQEL